MYSSWTSPSGLHTHKKGGAVKTGRGSPPKRRRVFPLAVWGRTPQQAPFTAPRAPLTPEGRVFPGAATALWCRRLVFETVPSGAPGPRRGDRAQQGRLGQRSLPLRPGSGRGGGEPFPRHSFRFSARKGDPPRGLARPGAGTLPGVALERSGAERDAGGPAGSGRESAGLLCLL